MWLRMKSKKRKDKGKQEDKKEKNKMKKNCNERKVTRWLAMWRSTCNAVRTIS